MDGEEIFNGTYKAAIFLMIMGEDYTAEIFRYLEEAEIKIIGEYMAKIKNLDPRLVAEVMAEFSRGLGRRPHSYQLQRFGKAGRGFGKQHNQRLRFSG